MPKGCTLRIIINFWIGGHLRSSEGQTFNITQKRSDVYHWKAEGMYFKDL